MSIKKTVDKNIETKRPYIIPLPEDKPCVICGKKRELRMGFCFACAEAQSIIADGVNMYDKEDHIGTQIPASEANARIKKLIECGWRNENSD